MIYSRTGAAGGDGVLTLPATVLTRAGPVLESWRLVPYERDALRLAMRAGRLWFRSRPESPGPSVLWARAAASQRALTRQPGADAANLHRLPRVAPSEMQAPRRQ